MKKLQFVAIYVGLGLLLAFLSGFVVWFVIRGDSLGNALDQAGGGAKALLVTSFVSFLGFGPAYIVASLAMAGVSAVITSWPFWVRCCLLGAAGALAFVLLEIPGILLLNGRGVPLIQNGNPYLIVALAAGALTGVFSAGLSGRLSAVTA
jgi:hypothetical protein